jgi:nitrogen fixation protein FixH
MTFTPARSRWGVGVFASFGVFVAAVLVMVYVSVSQRVDLVTDRYYDQALRYQERIDAQRHAGGPEDLSVGILPGELLIQFPATDPRSRRRGTIMLYRPADMSRDITMDIAVDSTGGQRVSTSSLDRGLWRVKVEWTVGGITRYHEEPVLIR